MTNDTARELAATRIAARAILAALEWALPIMEKHAHPFNHEHTACEKFRAAIKLAKAAGIGER